MIDCNQLHGLRSLTKASSLDSLRANLHHSPVTCLVLLSPLLCTADGGWCCLELCADVIVSAAALRPLLLERDYVAFGFLLSQIRLLSVVCDVCAPHLGVETFGSVSPHIVP